MLPIIFLSFITQTFINSLLFPFTSPLISVWHNPSCAVSSSHPYFSHPPLCVLHRWGEGEWAQLPDSRGYAGSHPAAEKAQAALHREGPGQHGRKCCMALPPYSCWFTSFSTWFFPPPSLIFLSNMIHISLLLFSTPTHPFTLYLPGCILCLFLIFFCWGLFWFFASTSLASRTPGDRPWEEGPALCRTAAAAGRGRQRWWWGGGWNGE